LTARGGSPYRLPAGDAADVVDFLADDAILLVFVVVGIGAGLGPAALAYASDRGGGDERISHAYTLVFPAAMIAKIVAVQFLV
jgi:hypothetical protein